jgi:hypothetical protein
MHPLSFEPLLLSQEKGKEFLGFLDPFLFTREIARRGFASLVLYLRDLLPKNHQMASNSGSTIDEQTAVRKRIGFYPHVSPGSSSYSTGSSRSIEKQ